MSAPPTAAEQRWREIVERQRAGGSTVAAFCRDHHIATSSFFAWKRKLRGCDDDPPAAFVEAAVVGTPPASRAWIEVRLRGGRRVRLGPGFDAGLLAAVVRTLEGMA